MKRLNELLLTWQDESITAEEIAELKQLLAQREGRFQTALEVFLTGVVVEALQMQRAAGLELATEKEEARLEQLEEKRQAAVPGRRARAAIFVGGLAASVAIVVGVLWLWLASPENNRNETTGPLAASAVFAKVEKIHGGLFVVANEKKLPVLEGQVLTPGQAIATGSADSEAVVDMDGIRFKMGGDTTVLTSAVERSPDGAMRLILEKGEMLLEVTRALKHKKARVVTRLGSVVAEAEPTSIHLSEAAGIVVIRGEATFHHKENGKSIRLRANEYVALTAEGEPYASEFFSGNGQVWTTFPGRGLNTKSLGHSLAFSPEGKYLAAVNWNGEGGVRVGPVSEPGKLREFKGVRPAVFSPDGRWLAAAEQITNMRFHINLYAWREPGLAPVQVLTTKEPRPRVQCLAFSPDSKWLAVGRVSGKDAAELEIWDVGTGVLQSCRREHMATITCLAFSPEGEYLASGSLDKAVILWDMKSGREKARIVVNPSQVVWALAFAPDSPTLAIATGPADFRIMQPSEVVLWDFDLDRVTARFVGHTHAVTSVVFSRDGQSLLTGSADTTIRFWGTKTSRQYGMFKGHRAAPGFEALVVALSPDGSFLATASFDQTVRVWPTNWIRVPASQDVFRHDFHRSWCLAGVTARGDRP